MFLRVIFSSLAFVLDLNHTFGTIRAFQPLESWFSGTEVFPKQSNLRSRKLELSCNQPIGISSSCLGKAAVDLSAGIYIFHAYAGSRSRLLSKSAILVSFARQFKCQGDLLNRLRPHFQSRSIPDRIGLNATVPGSLPGR
ncbi:hypothetical protein BKA64DRAFT_358868 [Cadophora sp. MPI-SDFR-AT-0126]|nr:hypothetical protein BKA64DRAFT_358868 [Leotiomycetes sp. MPI-SDFR-AT-0126]